MSRKRNEKLRSWAIIVVTNVLSLICLAWVLSGAGLQHIWGEVQHMHWHWVVIALVADALVYLLHGWRWKLLLRPVENVSFLSCIQAIYVGLFANEVLPLRAGELIRCFLLSRSTELPISVTFASALIERIFDGIWLMTCFFMALHMGKLPGVLIKGGYILGIMIVACGIIIGFAMYAKQQSLDRFVGIAWPGWFNTLNRGSPSHRAFPLPLLFVLCERSLPARPNPARLRISSGERSACPLDPLLSP